MAAGAGYGRSAGGGGGSTRAFDLGAEGEAGGGDVAATRTESSRERRQRAPADDMMDRDNRVRADAPAAAEEAEPRPATVTAATGTVAQQPPPPPMRRPMPGGQWMRRVWYRTGSVVRDGDIRGQDLRGVAVAEAALAETPDSRDRTRGLYRALARAGDLGRARELVDRWIERDQLDPDALTSLSDVLGRQGKRDEAVRILSGIVDLRADDATLQERLAAAFDRATMPERACSHRIALAEIRRTDADAIATAVRCERALGHDAAAGRMLSAISDTALRTRVEAAVARVPTPARVGGDLMLNATWSGGEDLDVSIVTSTGSRLSWMGGRTTVVGENATSTSRERLGLRHTPAGTYYVEISRTRPGSTTAISGTISAEILGMNGSLPFHLSGDRVVAGRIEVTRESRMEAVTGAPGGGGMW
jgi:hypothetical protein